MANGGRARGARSGGRVGHPFVLLAALVSAGILGSTAEAAADPPVRQEFTSEVSGPHFLSGICGFTILQDGAVHGIETAFEDGRTIVHLDVDLVLTANGKVALENPRFAVVIDPADGTVTLTGTLVNVHAPGQGQLLKEVGRVQDLATGDPLFSAGRFMIREGELDKICSFFGTTP